MMSLNFSFETRTHSPTILCDIRTNPWCEEFGVRQYVELIYLLLVTFCGSVGNIVVILSLSVFGNILQNGNLFTLNLAVADLIVSSFVTELSVLFKFVHKSSAWVSGSEPRRRRPMISRVRVQFSTRSH